MNKGKTNLNNPMGNNGKPKGSTPIGHTPNPNVWRAMVQLSKGANPKQVMTEFKSQGVPKETPKESPFVIKGNPLDDVQPGTFQSHWAPSVLNTTPIYDVPKVSPKRFPKETPVQQPKSPFIN